MKTESTQSGPGLPLPRIVSRLVEMLEYALNDIESEELVFEVTVHGMAWEEDERSDLEDDENPDGMFNEKYLGDPCVLDSEEFSTTEERCAYGKDPISREDLRHLISLLGSAWIPASDGLPNHAEWVLIVVDNSARGLPHTVGMGWRKWQNDAWPSGWWQTNTGLVHQTLITHWMPAPSLPN